ncbi:MAG: dihydrofolate reductase [Patescibacteria group bacterium]
MLNRKILKIAFASSEREDDRRVIGKGNDLPGWQGLVPSDMSRFVRLTSYHSVIPGRKTWDSLSNSFKPLKNRQNIILTHDTNFRPEFDRTKLGPNTEVAMAHSLEEAVMIAKSENVWIIGGAEIYALALPYTDYLHWTMIHEEFDGDTFFPYIDWNEWRKIGEEHCSAGISGTEKKKDQIDSSYYAFRRVW